jgi:hypothetical protein
MGFALALALVCAPAMLADEFSQVSHYRVRLFSMGTLTVETRTGDITITGWDDPHVVIRARKVVRAGSAKKAQPLYQHIKVRLEGADTQVRLRTIYPPRRPWRPFRDESKLTVNFHIRMPYDASLVLHTVDGDVTIHGLTGNQRIIVNYGDVEDDLSSAYIVRSLYAHTLLGTIQSDLNGTDGSGFGQKTLFWNPYGKQTVTIYVRMGGVFIYAGN